MMHIKSKMRSSGVFCCLLLPLSFSVYGNPSIENVEDEGNTIIIKGDQFGSHDLDVAVTDTVDGRKVVKGGGPSTTLEYDGFWGQLGSGWADPLTAEAKNGPLGYENNQIYSGMEKAFNGWPNVMDDETNRSLYVSWWYKPNMSPEDNGGSNKFIRIWDENDGQHSRISWTQMHLTYGDNDTGIGGDDWYGWNGTVGEWNLMEIYVNSDDGTIKTWVNGELTHDVDDFQKSQTDKGLTIGLIGFDPSVSSNYPGMETNIDDIYFSTSRARVVASKKQTWSEARKDHFSVLPLSWKTNEVKAEVSDKISSNLKDYFFYVIDESGNANSEGVGLCSECPAPLDNLRVE